MDIGTLLSLNKVLPKNKARLLMGSAGIGKSSIVRHLADEDEADLVVIKLSEYEPQDLVGLPYLENIEYYLEDSLYTEKVTKFARPNWWPVNPNKKVYVFLDELDRCREDMHPSAMQLALDRRAGGRKLHDNVVIWAACNGEEYLTIPIDQALMDRFAVVHLEPTVSEWLSWARRNDVDKSVIDFIKQNPGMLDTPSKMIGKPNVVCPTRRSWSDFGELLLRLNILEEENLLAYGSVFVGYEASAAYSRWVKDKYQVISAEDIFAGTLNVEDFDILNIACAADDVADVFMKKHSEEQYACLSFFKQAGPEAFANLFEALPQEASYVVRDFDDIHEYVTSMRKQVIKKVQ